eukprot:scaffold40038_cov30-Phaeocystis_antarctica.AAC.3
MGDRRSKARPLCKTRGSYDFEAPEPRVGGLGEARTRWTWTGRRNRPGTACAARAELNGY